MANPAPSSEDDLKRSFELRNFHVVPPCRFQPQFDGCFHLLQSLLLGFPNSGTSLEVRCGSNALAVFRTIENAAPLHCFPGSVSGLLPATIYGFIPGLVRKDANGLLAPIVIHLSADLIIFVIPALTQLSVMV